MLPLEKIDALVTKNLDEIIALRREFHQRPELGGQETATAARVADILKSHGWTVRTAVGGTGVVATLGSGGPCVALRADMDALPIQECTSLEYASSTPGVMHACGHDFHTAWLVGVGLVASALGLPRGTLKLIFQPAEETLHGATGMIADGALENPSVDAICGAHVAPDLLTGHVTLSPGPNLAAADRFRLQINGVGSHGASAYLGKDPIPVAAEIILALQTLVTRRLDPIHSAVLSVCQINAGSAYNIIPDCAELGGTVRTLVPEDQDLLEQALGEMATAIAAAHGCTVDYEYMRGVPATITDPAMTSLAEGALVEVLGRDKVSPREAVSMGAEDFSYFLQRCPGALLAIGCSPDEAATKTMSLHNAKFQGEEACLAPTIKGLLAIALTYLQQ
ncbi:MAG: M20 metallopeptidase family protein [Armatimonadota bacterium]